MIIGSFSFSWSIFYVAHRLAFWCSDTGTIMSSCIVICFSRPNYRSQPLQLLVLCARFLVQYPAVPNKSVNAPPNDTVPVNTHACTFTFQSV